MNAKKKDLVVIDTNVIVSGFLGDNSAYLSKIIDEWLFRSFQVAVSHELKQELNQVFKRPHIARIVARKQKPIRPILGRLLNKSLMISPISINKVTFSDKKDHFLLELAITAQAAVIVTGDRRLLNTRGVKGIQISALNSFI